MYHTSLCYILARLQAASLAKIRRRCCKFWPDVQTTHEDQRRLRSYELFNEGKNVQTRIACFAILQAARSSDIARAQLHTVSLSFRFVLPSYVRVQIKKTCFILPSKVIIKKSRGKVSLLEQDTIENVSQPMKNFQEKRKTLFYATLQCGRYNFFYPYFFLLIDYKNLKKTASKVAHNRPKFFQQSQPA